MPRANKRSAIELAIPVSMPPNEVRGRLRETREALLKALERVDALEGALKRALALPERVQSFQIITDKVHAEMVECQRILDDKLR